jgi:hypothetical protein
VLIPDTLEDEESFLQQLVEAGVIPGDWTTSSRLQMVYYCWVVDSICADFVAPVDNYRIDTVSEQFFAS